MSSPEAFDPSATHANFRTTHAIDERVGVQPRDPEFGEGITQRVYEVQYGDYVFGVNLGDVAQVPTEAVMIPSTPWLEIGGGAIENVLHEAIGAGLYDGYAQMVRSSLEECAVAAEGPEKEAARAKLADSFVMTAGMDRGAAEEMAANLSGGSRIAVHEGRSMPALILGEDGELRKTTYETPDHISVELDYGEAAPCVAGDLSDRGINSTVVVNVTPSSSTGMTREHMVMFTHNAARVASMMGARSLTVPAVGTGFAAAFGFGMSMEDSVSGFFEGAKRFVDSGQAGNLQRLDFNIYARPSAENATQIAQLVRDAGVLDMLAA